MPATIRTAVCATLLLLPWFPLTAQDAGPPSRAEIGARLRLPSDGDRLRGQLDAVGFVVTQAQAEDVLGCLMAEESPALAEQDERLGMTPESNFIGGICPHDDHLCAGRLYLRLTERIAAPRVILLGVFHKARLWNLEGRLVFDEFEAWHGPWGDVPVDALRAEPSYLGYSMKNASSVCATSASHQSV
ncbi:MAG: hypothetical protein HY812_01780 [Planctomycetes bacterium]|nr:hypothetical protein [Planctomycetota bacterium]